MLARLSAFVGTRNWSARRCGSVAAFCTWFTSGIRFYCGVLCSITPAVCLLTNRTACGMLRFYSAGSRSPFARPRDVGAVICLGWFTSGLDVFLWRSRRDCRGHGERGWRRGLYALLRNHIGFAVLSAGSTLGLNVEAALRPPQTAPKSLRLSGLSSGAGRAAECALRGGVVLVQILIPAKSASAPISAPTRAKPGYMERPDRL